MATIKTKAQLYADAVALPNPITRTALVAHLDNIVASYENIIQEYTTVQRNALTPFEGQKIYNTTSNRLEYYSASMWLPCSQKETVAVDCSANPNYQEGLVGDQYIVTVAGIIGGGSGKTVSVGDLVYCVAPNAGGTEASVGTSWKVCYSNSSTNTPTLYAEVSLSSAEILALFTTPKTLVAATGAGTIILPERYIINFDWASVQYATHINLQAKMGSVSGRTIFQIDPVADKQYVYIDSGEIVSNTSLVLTVASGNPTAGNSIMTVGVYYKVHTL
jgi:hypothetical protein